MITSGHQYLNQDFTNLQKWKMLIFSGICNLHVNPDIDYVSTKFILTFQSNWEQIFIFCIQNFSFILLVVGDVGGLRLIRYYTFRSSNS